MADKTVRLRTLRALVGVDYVDTDGKWQRAEAGEKLRKPAPEVRRWMLRHGCVEEVKK